jgi:hypothetical protein
MSVLSILIVLALLATIGALGMGLMSMMRGGEYDREHSEQFMFARVGFQGVALVLLLAALFFANACTRFFSGLFGTSPAPGRVNADIRPVTDSSRFAWRSISPVSRPEAWCPALCSSLFPSSFLIGLATQIQPYIDDRKCRCQSEPLERVAQMSGFAGTRHQPFAYVPFLRFRRQPQDVGQ